MNEPSTDGPTPVRTAVVIAPSPVPLRLGGAERHWETLRRSLENAGVEADLVKVPVREQTLLDLLDGYETFATIDLDHVDLVISGKYPAWMLQHRNHVVWMLHPLRGLYDTYNAAAHESVRRPPRQLDPLVELLDAHRTDPAMAPPDPFDLIDLVRSSAHDAGLDGSDPADPLALPGPLARSVVHLLDGWALDPRRIRRHLCISSVVAGRADYFPAGVEPEVLTPPSCLPDPPSVEAPPGSPERVRFLAVGRLDEPKRFDLAVRAMQRSGASDRTLTIVGDGPDRDRLEAMAGGDPRITFAGRLSDAELADAYLNSNAVLVTPRAEDFGYVTIEAFQAGRPVITTTDSGGPADLATPGHDALVVEPDPAAIEEAMTRIATDQRRAARMGDNARATAAEHSWPAAVDSLLEAPPVRRAAPGRRGRIAALSTYPIADWPGGGPQRARHLLGALAARGWDVEVVSISPDGNSTRSTLGVGLTEVSVPLSQQHLDAERRLRRLTANVSITDVAASVLWRSSPELARAAREALDGAQAVVAVQPYLAPMALDLAPDVALVLDAHNHERTLKAQMFPATDAGRWMLDRVTDAEGVAVSRARVVVATTAEDGRSLEDDHGLQRGSVTVIPNGVDTGTVVVPTAEERLEARRKVLAELDPGGSPTAVAVFVGSAHRPNIDAAREVLAMAPATPGVLFLLSGEHSDQLDPHDCPANVRLLGAVSNDRLVELLAAADVALNPMRSGGGSNLKVLRYFAAGVPVISTATGVRGIEDPQRYATVVRIDGFVDAIKEIALHGAPAELAAAARELVEQHYDWSVASSRFAALVETNLDATQSDERAEGGRGDGR